LPAGLVGLVDGERLVLARRFPVELAENPAWLTLSVSPANTLQRLWVLSLVLTCYVLARQAAVLPDFPRLFSMVVGAGLILVGASDIWYRLDSGHTIIGLWAAPEANAAGAFANPNHFANWIYVAALLALGWSLRNGLPMHSARLCPMPASERYFNDTLFLLCAVFFSMVLAVASASRGGWLAFLVGLVVWVILLAKRTRSRTRWLIICIAAAAGFCLVLVAGGALFRKLAVTSSHLTTGVTKFDLWAQSLHLWRKFPLLGIGWGTFGSVFDYYKPFEGNATAFHAENDYLQCLVETGLTGALVFGILLWCGIGASLRLAWRRRLAEPELVFGAIAGLVAFAVHAVFEFVSQVPANCLLVAALFGFVLGSRDQARGNESPRTLPPGRALLNMVWSLVILAVAVLQGWADLHWLKSRHAESPARRVAQIERALRLWPWDAKRHIALTRAQAELMRQSEGSDHARQAEQFHQRLSRAVRWDPYNWPLRLERAWFDLAFSTNTVRAQAQAWEVTKLNPLQPLIPLSFARYFANRHPAIAREFLRQANPPSNPHLHQVFGLSWQMDRQTAMLWSLTPDTVQGLMTLGQFALEQKLYGLAAQAFEQLTNRVDTLVVADKLLQARRPDLVLTTIAPSADTPEAKLLLAKAHYQLGEYSHTVRLAESICVVSPLRKKMLTPASTTEPLSALLAAWRAQSQNAPLALRLAEKICQSTPANRDLELLRQLATQFPEEPRLAHLLYQTELILGNLEAAAQTALKLATRAVEGK
jgi:O-antigen ligase